MKYISKTLFAAAALVAGAALSSSGALAYDASDCLEELGAPHPNKPWTWVVQEIADVKEVTENGYYQTSGGSKGTATVNGFTTVTTTTYEVTKYVCVAINHEGHETDKTGLLAEETGDPIGDPVTVATKVCGAGKDADGNPYPAC
jgi:hypothetical protein